MTCAIMAKLHRISIITTIKVMFHSTNENNSYCEVNELTYSQ